MKIVINKLFKIIYNNIILNIYNKKNNLNNKYISYNINLKLYIVYLI